MQNGENAQVIAFLKLKTAFLLYLGTLCTQPHTFLLNGISTTYSGIINLWVKHKTWECRGDIPVQETWNRCLVSDTVILLSVYYPSKALESRICVLFTSYNIMTNLRYWRVIFFKREGCRKTRLRHSSLSIFPSCLVSASSNV
jgi:hypothetical protein